MSRFYGSLCISFLGGDNYGLIITGTYLQHTCAHVYSTETSTLPRIQQISPSELVSWLPDWYK